MKISYALVILSIISLLYLSLLYSMGNWFNFIITFIWISITILIYLLIYRDSVRRLESKIKIIYLSGVVLYAVGYGSSFLTDIIDETIKITILYLGFLIPIIVLSFLSPILMEPVYGGFKTMILSGMLFSLSSIAMCLKDVVYRIFLTSSLIILIYLLFSVYKYRVLSPSTVFFLVWSIILIIFLIFRY